MALANQDTGVNGLRQASTYLRVTLRDLCCGGLVSELRIETFRDRCRVAVGLIVLRILYLGRELGVITQSHSQTVQHTLDTANVIPSLRVLVPARLGNVLPQLLEGSGLSFLFVCNLAKFVGELRHQLLQHLRHAAGREHVLGNLRHCWLLAVLLRHAVDQSLRRREVKRVLPLSESLHDPPDWPTQNTSPDVLNDVLLAPTAAIVVNEFLLVAVPCNNTLGTEFTIVLSCSSGLTSFPEGLLC